METIGFLQILFHSPLEGVSDLQLETKQLTARVGSSDYDRVELQPFGTRSAELLEAVNVLKNSKRLAVTVRPLHLPAPVPPAPPTPPAATSAAVTLNGGGAGAAAATPLPAADEAAAAPPPPFPQPPLPPLPAGVGLVELELALPYEVWSHSEQRLERWWPRKQAVLLLGAVVPLDPDAGAGPSGASGSVPPPPQRSARYWAAVAAAVEDLLEEQPPGGDRERYSLISCFKELPSLTQRDGADGADDAAAPAAPAALPHLEDSQRPIDDTHSRAVDAAEAAPAETALAEAAPADAVGADDTPPAGLLDLPSELLLSVVSQLGPLDLARLRATCTALAEAGDGGGAVPGVRLTLYPHQRAAIAWMLSRERSTEPAWHRRRFAAMQPPQGQQDPHPEEEGNRPGSQLLAGPQRHPAILELPGASGLVVWADVGGGALRTSPPPQLPALRGGFFCDEPGLGKTITALSLVLKTLGQLPAPPPGAAVTWSRNRDGQLVGYYAEAAGTGGAGGGAAAHAGAAAASPNGIRTRRGQAAAAAATAAAAAAAEAGGASRSSPWRSAASGRQRGGTTAGLSPAAAAGAGAFTVSTTPTLEAAGSSSSEAAGTLAAPAEAQAAKEEPRNHVVPSAMMQQQQQQQQQPELVQGGFACLTGRPRVKADGGAGFEGACACGNCGSVPSTKGPSTPRAAKAGGSVPLYAIGPGEGAWRVKQEQEAQPAVNGGVAALFGASKPVDGGGAGFAADARTAEYAAQPFGGLLISGGSGVVADAAASGEGADSGGGALRKAPSSPPPPQALPPLLPQPEPAAPPPPPDPQPPQQQQSCELPMVQQAELQGLPVAGTQQQPSLKPQQQQQPLQPLQQKPARKRVRFADPEDVDSDIPIAAAAAAAAAATGGKAAAVTGPGASAQPHRLSHASGATAAAAAVAVSTAAVAAVGAAENATADGAGQAPARHVRSPRKRPAVAIEDSDDGGEHSGEDDGAHCRGEAWRRNSPAAGRAGARGRGSPAVARGGRSPSRGRAAQRGGGGGAAGRGKRGSTKAKAKRRRRSSGWSSSDESDEDGGDGSSSDDEMEVETESDGGSSGDGSEYDSDGAVGGRGGRRGRGGRAGGRGGAARGRGGAARGRGGRRGGRGGRAAGRSGGVETEDGGSGETEEEVEAGSAGEGEERGEELWVSCDHCYAWRKLPAGTQVPEGDPWFCQLHPLPHLASCSAPREAYGPGHVFQSAPGFLRPGEPAGSEANAAFFETALRGAAAQAGGLQNVWKALRWLALLDPSALDSEGRGVTMPVELRMHCPAYDTVFRAFDLRPVAEADAGGGGGKRRPAKRGGGGGGGGGGGRGRGRRGGAGGGGGVSITDWHTWRAAPYVRGLRMDLEALTAAYNSLCAAPRSVPGRTYLSGGTLVVLPSTLIDHWLLQIRTHIAPNTLRVCVLDRLEPRAMPSAAELAWGYDLVITTFQRLSAAAAGANTAPVTTGAAYAPAPRLGKGSVRSSGKGGSAGSAKRDGILAALLQVHWLRLILDEGHLLGSTSVTNKLQMACRIRAERRWVMTGTPTPATPGSSAAHLQPLLAVLHQEPYGTNAAAWQAVVQRPLDGCRPEGRRRLMELLRACMIRASKADLVLLPRLVRRPVLLDFEPQHAASYNELVENVRRNLLTSDWCDEAHGESLLNAANARWSRQMMGNVWLSCCVAGSTNSVVKEEDLLETLQLLAGRLGLPPPQELLPGGAAVGPPWSHPGHPLWETERALRHGTDCQVCGQHVRQPMVTPCGHLTCLDCTATDRERCPLPGCRMPYAMQSVDDPARRKHNSDPKWPVPQELIEWQPVYHQRGAEGVDGGTWAPTWSLTRSSKVSYVLDRLRQLGAIPGVLVEQEAGAVHADGNAAAAAGAAGQEAGAAGAGPAGGGAAAGRAGDAGSGGGGKEPAAAAGAPVVGGGGAADAGDAAAVAAGSGGGGGGGGGGGLAGHLRRTPVRCKVIVFTQYGQHMQLMEAGLMQAEIPFALLATTLPQQMRDAALSRFQHDPHCGVLLMDKIGAVGLDLSFASHVILMEPLEDTSLEQQVVSRAHRMGAEQAVLVETLVMRGSAEEALLRLDRAALQAAAATAGAAAGAGGAAAATAGSPGGAAATAAGRGGAGPGGPQEPPSLQQQRQQQGSQRRRPRGGGEAAEAPDVEGGVQVDKRALRNHLFLLLKKVDLKAGEGAGRGRA